MGITDNIELAETASTIEHSCMLTTFDNPYDPFEDFTHWFMYDTQNGYDSCSRLARIAKLSDDMTQKEVDEEIERAIDEIIKYDFMNKYKKIRRQQQTTK